MERALGEENVVTLETLNALGGALDKNKEYEEAIEVYERFLAGRMKALGKDHDEMLATLGNFGIVYDEGLKNYEKALVYYERALKWKETTLGKSHPSTLDTVMNIACLYNDGLNDFEKAEELYQRALEGYEAQLGKHHRNTNITAKNLSNCLKKSGDSERLAKLKKSYPSVEY